MQRLTACVYSPTAGPRLHTNPVGGNHQYSKARSLSFTSNCQDFFFFSVCTWWEKVCRWRGVLLRLPRSLLSNWQLLPNILTETSWHCLSFRRIKWSFIYFVSCSLPLFIPVLIDGPQMGKHWLPVRMCVNVRARMSLEGSNPTRCCVLLRTDRCMIHSSPAGDRCSSQKYSFYCENQLIKCCLQKFFFSLRK